MKKYVKGKRLFIDELEVRRSTSPLLVQTMAVGESGVGGKEDKGGSSSKESLAKGQKAKEKLVEFKNKPIPIIGPEPTTTNASGEDVIHPKPKPIIGPTTAAVGEEGRPPKPIPIIGPTEPEVTTLAVGEEGLGLKPSDKPKPIISVVTTAAVGEEGRPPKPIPIIGPTEPPVTTQSTDESGTGTKPPPIFIGPPVPAPEITTLAVGEEGMTAIIGPVPAPKPNPYIGPPVPAPKVTTLAVGEEGTGIKPAKLKGK